VPRRPSVIVAEDHAIVAQGLKGLLEKEFEVLEIVSRGTEVPGACARRRPDVLLLDLTMPGRNGIDLMPDVRRRSPETRIVVVTMHADPVLAKAAFAAGAQGFLPKDCDLEELREAIGKVMADQRFLSPRIPAHRQRLPASPASEAYWQLSPKQRDILKAIGEGKSTEEIAGELGLSPHTIHFHRRRMRKVLGIGAEEGLMRFAVQFVLAPPRAPRHKRD